MIKIKLKKGKKISMSEETALDLYNKLSQHFHGFYAPFYTIYTGTPETYPKPGKYGWIIE
jgi:hypothetical protein